MSKKIILFIAILLLPSSVSLAKRGCCSYHGGVAYCGSSGYYICNDGTRSPSCTCGGGYEVELVDGPACNCNYYSYENEIKSLEKDKKELNTKIDSLQDENSSYEFWLIIFGIALFILGMQKLDTWLYSKEKK